MNPVFRRQKTGKPVGQRGLDSFPAGKRAGQHRH